MPSFASRPEGLSELPDNERFAANIPVTGPAIDFYFDFSSPYGYFASTQIEALGRELGREVAWHAILLGPMFKAMGSAPLIEIPMKGDYAKLDFQRSADLNGIPFVLPDRFPIASVGAARAMLHLQRSSDEAGAKRFARTMFDAYFVRRKDIGDEPTMLEVAAEAGFDAPALAAAIQRPEIKEALKAGNAQAMARGVFGSPFVFVDDEPFWGFDRFSHIRQRASQAKAT